MQPRQLEIMRGPLPSWLQAAVVELARVAAQHDGAKPLSDAVLLASPAAARHLVVFDAGAVPNDGTARPLIGYGHVDPATWTVEFVVAPAARSEGMGSRLADQAIALGATGAWAHADLPAARALAAARGMLAERTLLVMTRDIDSGEGGRTGTATPADLGGLALRSYQGADDDAALLAVNAAAFVELPDQGGWTAADLAARTAAPWFHPDDLLLLIDPAAAEVARNSLPEGRLAGFHWTKVHPDGTGEVYVVAVDPDYQGQGLGAPLTLAGLAHLAARGCRVVGLFVDASNAPARGLYSRLGFTTARRDVLYRVADR